MVQMLDLEEKDLEIIIKHLKTLWEKISKIDEKREFQEIYQICRKFQKKKQGNIEFKSTIFEIKYSLDGIQR